MKYLALKKEVADKGYYMLRLTKDEIATSWTLYHAVGNENASEWAKSG